MKIAEVLEKFTNNQYIVNSPQKQLTIESRKLVEEGIDSVITFLSWLDRKVENDADLTLILFTSAFILGRMYEKENSKV